MKRRNKTKRGKPAKAATEESQNAAFNVGQLVRLLADAAIAVERRGQREKFAELLGTNGDAVALLKTLARGPEGVLAREFSAPAIAMVEAISEMAWRAKDVADAGGSAAREDWQQAAAAVLEQLHLAMAFIFRRITPFVMAHAGFSKNCDLLCEAIGHAIGDGHEAVNLIDRYQTLFPDDGREADATMQPESWPDQFAWDAYQRIDQLDGLADRYPEHLKTAARQMNAWPMLRYRHTESRARFDWLAEQLELGLDYPTDTSKAAKFRPDTPMVRYLDRLVWRFHCCHRNLREIRKWETDEAKAIARAWRERGDPKLDEGAEAAIRASLTVDPLTKRTAPDWAKKAMVPYIMATDTKTAETCTEPALESIWKQNGVKSTATFKSRLLPQVVRTLESLARPG
ncbi:MAG: hypothetical protein AAB676_04885 [Verrucomicrobiota bacterium]